MVVIWRTAWRSPTSRTSARVIVDCLAEIAGYSLRSSPGEPSERSKVTVSVPW
jgi:hypothetical protein